MGEIRKLPPVYQIPSTRPPAGNRDDNPSSQRKPTPDDRDPDRQRRRQPDDDVPHVDEYA